MTAHYFLLIISETNQNNISNFSYNLTLNTNDCNQQVVTGKMLFPSIINDYSPIGFSIGATSICNTNLDGTELNIDDNYIGVIGGNEPFDNVNCSGVTGSFYYRNSTLVGLDNDTANITMNESDGLALINSYVNDTDTLDFELEHINPFGPPITKTNTYFLFNLIGTTPCDTFTVEVDDYFKLCNGADSVQLSASGGVEYLGQPATGLSCTDCPNPKAATTNGSMGYIVQIWNNDTCSVVRPIQLEVVPQPVYDTLIITDALCGYVNGEIEVVSPYNFYET